MHQFLVVALSGIIVEAHRERNDILGNHVSIDFVFQVYFWIVLELFEVGRREKSKAVTLKCPAGELVHHLKQSAVKHFYVVCTILYEELVNFIVGNIP